MKTSNETTAMETSNHAEQTSNIDSQRYVKTEKFLRGFVRPAIMLAYEFFKLLAKIIVWIMIPYTALLFTMHFVPILGTDTYGQYATVILFIVAAIAGIKAASDACARIDSFKINI